MKYLQQRKPLGTVQKDGTVQITREFGDDIERLSTLQVKQIVEPADLTALREAIKAIQISIASLVLQVSSFDARLKKLESGFQS